MRIKNVKSKILLLVVCMLNTLCVVSQNQKPFVIPELKEWKGKQGEFIPGAETKIVCDKEDPELIRIANILRRATLC